MATTVSESYAHSLLDVRVTIPNVLRVPIVNVHSPSPFNLPAQRKVDFVISTNLHAQQESVYSGV